MPRESFSHPTFASSVFPSLLLKRFLGLLKGEKSVKIDADCLHSSQRMRTGIDLICSAEERARNFGVYLILLLLGGKCYICIKNKYDFNICSSGGILLRTDLFVFILCVCLLACICRSVCLSPTHPLRRQKKTLDCLELDL